MTKIKEPRPNESYFGWEEGSITFIDQPITRGGPGSGHHGHKGRPGEVGGSLPSGEAGKHIERHPDNIDVYENLQERASKLKYEGKFAMVTRDIKTGEYLLILDRETAIDKLGNDRRHDNREHLYGFSTTELFFQKRGKESSVRIQGYELSDLRGFGEEAEHYGGTMVLSHNHPPAVLGEFMPPSPTDIYTATYCYAGEMRTYTGDGDYIVRIDKFGSEASQELKAAITEFEDANFSERFPNIDRDWSLAEERTFVIQNELADELKVYQLDRLNAISEALPWLSYEFRPID